jgi:hypothetical protein
VVRVFDNVNDTNFPNSIYAFLNSGAATFHLKSKVPTEAFGGFVYLADIDGDGLADIISVSGSFRSQEVEIALGHGDGTFGMPFPLDTSVIGSQGGLVARDLNLDSRHDLAITSVDALDIGLEATHIFLNQNGRSNCIPPPSTTLAVKICSPAPNAGVRRTFTVKASGNSPAGVKRMELWVDGVKHAQNFSDQLRSTITLSLGTHRVTVVGVDQFDSLVKTPIVVHVF